MSQFNVCICIGTSWMYNYSKYIYSFVKNISCSIEFLSQLKQKVPRVFKTKMLYLYILFYFHDRYPLSKILNIKIFIPSLWNALASVL